MDGHPLLPARFFLQQGVSRSQYPSCPTRFPGDIHDAGQLFPHSRPPCGPLAMLPRCVSLDPRVETHNSGASQAQLLPLPLVSLGNGMKHIRSW